MSLILFRQPPLSPDDERELINQHEADLRELVPTLGPLFGIAVLLFSVWDYFIDAQHAPITVFVRVAFALLGSLAYLPSRLRWTATQRCGYLYWTYASAIIVCEFLLQDGFFHGIAGVTGCIFTVSALTLRGRTFLTMLSVPALLFVALAALKLSPIMFVNGLLLYVFCAVLAYMLMLVIRFFRYKAFLLQSELTQVSRHDSLTGVYRRGYLTELAEREMAMAKRHRRPLAIVMLDIDRFKRINDSYGHDIGDQVIKALAAACTASLRQVDHFGRIGGEEFVWVLPETNESDALGCAERLRRRIENLEVETPKGIIRFTVSMGVALLNERHADWSALLKDADTALYRAKNEGRNRVVLA